MRIPRSLAAQSPSIVISILALTFSLGGGAYAATQTSSQHLAPAVARPCTAVKFHALKLENGWKSDQAAYDSGNPSYGICNGVVYLAGSLVQLTAGSGGFGSLPRGYRPAHDLYITVYTNGYTTGSLYIGSNGDMYAISVPQSRAEAYTSLAAVSFPLGS
jgi:hypothetical protein